MADPPALDPAVADAVRRNWESAANELPAYDGTNLRAIEDALDFICSIRGCKWYLDGERKAGDAQLGATLLVILRRAVGSKFKYLLRDINTFDKALEAVQKHHKAASQPLRDELREKLITRRMTPQDSVTDYLQDFNKLREDFIDAGGTVDGQTFIDVVVRNLAVAYITIKTDHAKKKFKDLQALTESLLAAWRPPGANPKLASLSS